MSEKIIADLKGFIARDEAYVARKNKTLGKKELQWIADAIAVRKVILFALENNRIARSDAELEALQNNL
jgi:hypothetical protein